MVRFGRVVHAFQSGGVVRGRRYAARSLPGGAAGASDMLGTEQYPEPSQGIMVTIGKTTFVEDNCSLESFVSVGERCTVRSGVSLMRNVLVGDGTEIGSRTRVFPNAVIGYPPQAWRDAGENTRLVIGQCCTIREGAKVERGTEIGGGETRIRNNVLIMSGAYVGHDTIIESGVTVSNNVSIAGHCHLHRECVIGGHAAVHQRIRIGTHAMVGGMTPVRKDVLPFTVVSGSPPALRTLNFYKLWPKLGFAGRHTALYLFDWLFPKGASSVERHGPLVLPRLWKGASLVERLDALDHIDISMLMSRWQHGDRKAKGKPYSDEIDFLKLVFHEISQFARTSSYGRGAYCHRKHKPGSNHFAHKE